MYPLAGSLGPLTNTFAVESFEHYLINVLGCVELWKLTDIVSGSVIPATINPARNGTINGSWVLQNSSTPIRGELGLAPDTTDSGALVNWGDVYTTSIRSQFNFSASTVMILIRKPSTASWTSGLIDRLICIGSNAGANSIDVNRQPAGVLRARINTSTGNTIVDANPSATLNWFMVTAGFSSVSNKFIWFNDNAPTVSAAGGGSWTAEPVGFGLAGTVGGAHSSLAGWAAYGAYWNRLLTTTEVQGAFAASGLP